MKAQKTALFLTGLFVSIGLVIGASAIIWLGATNYFQKGKVYVSYFDESVQGLSPDSVVKFRGVEVGRVQGIGVAPDNKLVEVIIKANLGGLSGENLVAQLKAAGITGIVFVELDLREKGEAPVTPEITFNPPYPVIPSRPSGMKRFLSDIDQLLDKLKKIDIQGLVNGIHSLVDRIDKIAADKRTMQIIANIDSTTNHMEKTMAKINQITSEGKVDDVLNETKNVMIESQTLLRKLDKDLDALKLAEQGDVARQWIGDMNDRTRIMSQDMQAAIENLRRVSQEMEILMERIQVSPGDMIFSHVPPEGRKGVRQ